MAKKNEKEFGEGLIFTVTNYIMWFFVGNLYFWLTNIVFIMLVLYVIASGNKATVPLILSTILMAPSFTALLSVMGKLIREKDISITKDFFKAYKSNFLESIFFWCLGIFVIFIFYIDIMYATKKASFTISLGIFNTVGILIAALGFYVFPIISRFYLRKIDVIKFALKYSIKKLYITIGIFVVLYFMIAFATVATSIIALFCVSILCYVIMFLEKNMLNEIQDKLNK